MAEAIHHSPDDAGTKIVEGVARRQLDKCVPCLTHRSFAPLQGFHWHSSDSTNTRFVLQVQVLDARTCSQVKLQKGTSRRRRVVNRLLP
jgi:hypothetical protein